MQIKPEIREGIRDLVSSLYELEGRLTDLAECLPLPPDAEDMWELKVPMCFITNLYSALEAVRTDCIQDAVATLSRAIRQSEESLRLAWARDVHLQNGQKRRILPGHHTPGNGAGRKEPPPC